MTRPPESDAADMPAETIAGIAPDAETVLAEPVDYPSTDAAWSQCDEEAVIERRSWYEVSSIAAGIVGVLVLVAFIGGIVAWVMTKPGDRDPSTPVPGFSGPAAYTLPRSPLPSSPQPPEPAPAPPVEPVASDPHDDEFVAVAISPLSVAVNDPQHAGAYGTSGTRPGASAIAVSECHKATGHTDCVPVNRGMFHGCVSFAIYGSAWAGGVGVSQAEAVLDAKRNLRAAGVDSGSAGVVLAVECSTPPGKSGQEIN
jgi:hypothetical protein